MLRRIGGWIAALSLGIAVSVAGAGGSYAYFSATTALSGATLTAGQAAFTLTATSALAPTGMYPGSGYSYGTYTLTNTGDVPLAIGMGSFAVGTTSAFTDGLVVELSLQPAGTTCSAVTSWPWMRSGTTTTGTLSGILAARSRTVAGSPNPTLLLCARASLPAGAALAAAQKTSTFTITLTGSQAGGSWTAPAQAGSASGATASLGVTLGNTTALTTEYTTTNWLVARLTLGNVASGAPLAYTLGVATTGSPSLPGSTSLALWAPGAAACATTPPGGTTIGTLASPPALPSGATAGTAGSSIALCAATRLSDLPSTRGKSLSATFTLTGRVGTNWVATATGTAAQRVAFGLTCANISGIAAGVTISWQSVAGAVSYNVYDDNNALVRTVTSGTSIRLNVAASGTPGTANAVYAVGDTAFVRVAAVESWGENAGSTITTRYNNVVVQWQSCS